MSYHNDINETPVLVAAIRKLEKKNQDLQARLDAQETVSEVDVETFARATFVQRTALDFDHYFTDDVKALIRAGLRCVATQRKEWGEA